MRRFFSKRWARPVTVVVAAALLWVPLLPALAYQSAPAMAQAAALEHVHHAPLAADAASDEAYGCAQHDGCQGQCCSICNHCFNAAPSFAPVVLPLEPVQTPAVLTLYSSLPPSALIRPPQG